MNKPFSESDFATPKVTTGPIAGSRKVYAAPEAAPDLRVPYREIALSEGAGEEPVRVYDPSGIYTDGDAAIDVEKGLKRNRVAWVKERGRSSRSITAMPAASIWLGVFPTRRSR
jgi:phosphomethylpyrimidine synthase